MKKIFIADARELKEIYHCLFYSKNLAHGTVGHNLLMLGAKAFETLGFGLDEKNRLIFEGIVVGESKLTAEIDVTVDDWTLTG